jgi:cell division protein FtsB
MPFTRIDNEISALQQRMKELLEESAALEARIADLKDQREALGALNPRRIIAGAEVVKEPVAVE